MPEFKKEVEKKKMFPNPKNPGEMITAEELAIIQKEQRENPEEYRENNK